MQGFGRLWARPSVSPPIGVTSFSRNNFIQEQNHNSRIKQDVSTVASRSRSNAGGGATEE